MDALALNVLAGILSSAVVFALMKMVITAFGMTWPFLKIFGKWTGEQEALGLGNSISRVTPLVMLEAEGTMPYSDPSILRDLEQGPVVRMDSDISTSDSGNRSEVHAEVHDGPDIAGVAVLVDEDVGFN